MKYTLKSLDGKLTGLQLVSYMYVGLRKIAPDHAAEIDLSKEYNKAPYPKHTCSSIIPKFPQSQIFYSTGVLQFQHKGSSKAPLMLY